MIRLHMRPGLTRVYICLLSALTRLTSPSPCRSYRAWLAGGDGVQVLADPAGGGVQFGLVVSLHALEPAGRVVLTAAVGHHLGEAGHAARQAVGCEREARR